MTRRSLIAVSAFLAIGGGAFWFIAIDPAQRHHAFYIATKSEFASLARKRPPTITRKQWHHIVAWTLNAHANCISVAQRIPQGERDRFLSELRERLRGPVELATIDWIWDELVRLCPGGQSYSDNWRPTSQEKLREFEEGNASWIGVEVD